MKLKKGVILIAALFAVAVLIFFLSRPDAVSEASPSSVPPPPSSDSAAPQPDSNSINTSPVGKTSPAPDAVSESSASLAQASSPSGTSSEPEVSSQTSAPEASEPEVSEPQTPSSVPENPASEPEVPESSEAPQTEPVPSTPSKSGGTQPGDRVYVPGFGWTVAGENGGLAGDNSDVELSGELNPNASFG